MSLRAPTVPLKRRVALLIRSCHPEPALTVTAIATVLAVAVGRTPAGSLAVAASVLAGQLSIGWSNDALDARRDIASGRTDKPLVTGELPPRAVAVAAAIAVLLSIPLSLLNGILAGTVHLVVAMGAAWSYNLWFKRTALSALPYAVAFGSLPAVASLGLPGTPWPAWWAMVAATMLGVGAHLINALPDLEDDLATGVHGMPHRLGPGRCRALTPLVMLAAIGLLLAGPPGTPSGLSWVLALTAGALVLGGSITSGKRAPFRMIEAAAVLSVVLFWLQGPTIV